MSQAEQQRLEALRQVTGGIAPAFSDLLTVMRGQAGALLTAGDAPAAMRGPLHQIFTAAEKAGSLLRQMLIFSGRQAMRPAVLDLNALLANFEGVLRQLAGHEIAVALEPGSNLPSVSADAEMLEQVFLVLTLNACEAMPTGGRLRLSTAALEISVESATQWPEGRAGKFVLLEVADTGRGIAPEIRPQIFEPFFTTKTGGKSAGLGLACVSGIVRQHGGWVAVESTVDAGARFTVFLPAAPLAAGASAESAADSGKDLGKATILVVEDDAALREFTVTLLQEAGLRVLQAGSSRDALEIWQWHGARIRLLLTDMVLEDKMSGLDLAAKLREQRPDLKVICTSGYWRDADKSSPALGDNFLYLSKPCRPQTLVAAVRALLVD